MNSCYYVLAGRYFGVNELEEDNDDDDDFD